MENWIEERKEKLKEASFNTFAKYFGNDKKKYLASLKKLTEENLEKFLKLERFYNFYFLRLQPTNPQSDPARDFKLITFFSLIEAIMSEAPWKPFEEWLSGKIPIEIKTKKDVERLKKEYYETYGSGKKAREFFNQYVEASDKKDFLNKFKISLSISGLGEKAKNVPLDNRIKIVYDARSKLIHDAMRLGLFPSKIRPPFMDGVVQVADPAMISKLGKYYTWSELDEELLQGILEKGMLRYFGLLA